MSYEKPYKGIRVVDMTHAVAGPYCGSMLARLGADVIKVEPEGGDISRGLGPVVAADHTLLSLLVNLGKRSICVDVKSEGGAKIIRELLETADVFVESFRPGVIKRLGLSYEEVKKINPRIIYLSVSGFGQRGPFAERPGTDSVMQAFSGFLSANKGFDGKPHKVELILFDLFAALYNLQSIQSALWARQNEENGRFIDNSLLETAAAFLNINLASQASQASQGDKNPVLAYPARSFKCKDGEVMLGVLFDREFKPLLEMLGLNELASDPRLETAKSRYENRELFDKPLEEAILKLDTDYLCGKLQDLRMLHERLNSYKDFMEHDQTQAMETLYWHEYIGIGKLPIANIPGMERLGEDLNMLHSPSLGEHTEMVLTEIGYSGEEVIALHNSGAIKTNSAA